MDDTADEMVDIVDTIDMNETETKEDEINETEMKEYEMKEDEINENEINDNNDEMNDRTSSQHTLIDYLKDIDDDIEYIHLDKNLYGVLDLSVISINHKNVKHIYFGEGNITEIINFPESLTKLECAKNLLSSLYDLPRGIIEIDVSHNMITMIDLKNLTKLQKIRCSWNRLTFLNELPDSLTDIIVDNNNITEIDLSGLVNLEKVECDNNLGIVVKNIPSGVTLDIDMKGGAGDNTANNEDKGGNSYDELLIKYFELKKGYEKLRTDVIGAYKKNPDKGLNINEDGEIQVNCVKCNGVGGTTFEKTKDVYHAVCNNPKKCFEIKIRMNSKILINLEESMNNAKMNVEKSKEEIIKQKMDTLFGYIQENESSKVFLEKAKKYTDENLHYEERVDDFNNIFHNAARDDSIRVGELKINEIQEEMDVTNNILLSTTDDEIRHQLIKDLVTMQIESSKNDEELTKLKYELNCVKSEIVGTPSNSDKNPIKKSKCIQYVVKFENRFVVSDKGKREVLIDNI